MEHETALQQSGQQWKLYFSAVVMALGILIFYAGKQATSPGWYMIIAFVGPSITVGTGIWLMRSVKCPVCRARWYWLAFSREKAQAILLGSFAVWECPVCRYPRNVSAERGKK